MNEKTSKEFVNLLLGITVIAFTFILFTKIMDLFLSNKMNQEVGSSTNEIDLDGSTSAPNRS